MPSDSAYHQRLHASRMARRQEGLRLRGQGLTLQEIGERWGVSRQAVHQTLKERLPSYKRRTYPSLIPRHRHRQHLDRPARYKRCDFCDRAGITYYCGGAVYNRKEESD